MTGPRGYFLTVEGIEGSGKSSKLDRLERVLRAEELDPVRTREPGGTPLAESARALLQGVRDEVPTPVAELFLIAAARAQHTELVLRPALAAGRIVLCDRYTDSSLAYQGAARGLGDDVVEAVNAVATGGLRPHRTVLFDLPVETALARIADRADTGELDRFDREAVAFHRAVREAYRALADADRDRFRVIEASGPRDAVYAEFERVVRADLAAHGFGAAR